VRRRKGRTCRLSGSDRDGTRGFFPPFRSTEKGTAALTALRQNQAEEQEEDVMQFDAELLLIAMAPVFLACIGWEAWHMARTRADARIYNWRDTLCNAALALMHQGADKLAWFAVVPIYGYVYTHYRLLTWEPGAFAFAVLFVAQDLLYYVFHRMSHRVRWLWAAHVVHHSSERLNLSTAFRQSLMYPVAGMWVFWLPLALIGFPPAQIVAIVLVNLAFQFFVHTQAFGRLGWLGYVLNTPSTHRCHHARNPRYIDRNFAGVLVIWDRIFGSYVTEDPADPPEYGIVDGPTTHNPLKATFHEWASMFADVARADGVRNKLRVLVAPPEWTAAVHSTR
jgi:sterol desaturase/sphingolipid hydroxylase (fatty acid hydroxylase superfamily)